jgi:hypothetical protein
MWISMGESPPTRSTPPGSGSPKDKGNVPNKKKIMHIVIIGITIIIAVVFFTSFAFMRLYIKQKTTIVDGVIDTPANNYTYYTFSVPAGASNARVTGNYEVHSGGGLIPRIDIYLADTSLCSSPLDCSSYYYVGKDKSFGEIDVYLPTSARSRQTAYYLTFHNIAPLGESKQTDASFKLEVS